MLVELGTAGFACCGADFRHGEYDPFGQPAHTVALVECDAGQRGDIDGQRSFVEIGKEAAPEGEKQSQRDSKQPSDAPHHRPCVIEAPCE